MKFTCMIFLAFSSYLARSLGLSLASSSSSKSCFQSSGTSATGGSYAMLIEPSFCTVVMSALISGFSASASLIALGFQSYSFATGFYGEKLGLNAKAGIVAFAACVEFELVAISSRVTFFG